MAIKRPGGQPAMSAHRAPGDLWKSRWVRLTAAGCAVVAVLAVAGWALLDKPDPTAAAGNITGTITGTVTGSGEPSTTTDPTGPAEPPLASTTGTPAASPTAQAGKPSASPARPGKPAGGPGQTQKFNVTLYGAKDNDPPGSTEIAYPKVHRKAGGTGTFADPITFATSKDELAIGTVIYYPYLKRYFVMEDQCVECEADWRKHVPHIDLWAGASTDAGIVACENSLTQDGQTPVVVNPSANLPVVTTPLYDGKRCYSP
jgi:hypothetical protein